MGVLSQVKPVLAEVSQFSYELTEDAYGEYEVNDPWAMKLVETVESAVEWLQPLLTLGLYDRLILSLADGLTSRLDAMMMQKRFNPLGGLQFDKDVRNLIGRLSSLTQSTVRDKFSRLQQIAIVLNLESVQEILDSWGDNAGSLSWRLSPAEVKKVMSLRVDFSPADIASLRL